jgi:ABC-type Zn uptake system ZnuABC Zn-binding protein ZnuA
MRTLLLTLLAAFAAASLSAGAAADEAPRLRALTTTTDLRELAKEVGGDDVTVACICKGPEDPHFVEARPSFVKAAAEADVLVVVGMDLEIGYESLLLSESRNAKIQKGQPGYVDCSAGVAALEVPTGTVDRSRGDVHPQGNPHYLADPVWGKHAAKTIAEAFARVDAGRAAAYRKRAEEFARRVDVAMWGEALLAEQKAERLEKRLADGTLLEFLKQRGLEAKLGGHAATLAPFAGRKVVAYHGTMLYLLARFHLDEIDRLEPKPGIPPTPKHLARVAERMRSEDARVVLYNAYQPERTARAMAEEVDGRAVRLAHMPESVPDTPTYAAMLAYNVGTLADALRGTATAR